MMMRSTTSLATFSIVLIFLSSSCFTPTEAYDRFDHNGNISIKWDVLNWTPDGYVAVVTIYNFQNREIQAPGWQLEWTFAGKEVIWAMIGAQTTEQGDCSRFKGNIPHSCKKNPTIIDLLPDTPYNQQIANCCKGGVLTSWFHYRPDSISAFQITVGQAGTTKFTVKMPLHYTFKSPGAPYICGPSKIVRPTKFLSPDRRRVTQALMTWNVTCLYSGRVKPTYKSGFFG